MQNLNSILSFSFLFIVSCRGQNNAGNFLNTNVDTSRIFIREIPTYNQGPRKGDTTYLFEAIRQDVKDLGLTSLENGYDSLEIRVWLGHSMALKRNVAIIRRLNNEWTAQLITFIKGHEVEGGKTIIKNKEVKETVPKSGWSNFIKKILAFKIIELPDENELLGYNGCGGDGLPYYFEIATQTKYRFFTYCNIEDNYQKFPEACYIDNIGKLLEEEFIFEFTR